MDKVTQVPNQSQPTSRKINWAADGVLLLTATVWGINILVFKFAASDGDAFGFNALRLVLALVTLVGLAIAEAMIWPAVRLKSPIPWANILLFSFLNGLIYLLLFVKAVPLTTAGNIALILASLPMWTALLSKYFFKEVLPQVTWIGLLITFVGTVIVITQGSRHVDLGYEYQLGNLLILLATMSWACATVVSRPIMSSITPLQLAAISSLLTAPIHVLIAYKSIPAAWALATQNSTYTIALVYSGVLSTGVAYATWNAGVRLVGASHASVFQNVVTLVAVIGGWAALGEQLVLSQILGGLLTIAGLLLMRGGRSQPRLAE
jgi:drug/metabolite transporter (DMT)-like permease